MKNIILKFIIPSLFLLFVMGNSIYIYSNQYKYVGYKTCDKCHSADSIGNQVKIWKKSPHSKAFRRLRSSNAKKIAEKANIIDPTTDYNCLKCHTTGAGKNPNIKAEGVGCESCHGPGEKYYEFSNHASFDNRKRAYNKAIKLGMYPIVGIKGIKTRERLCKHCHTLERPCAPKDSKEKEKKKLSLSIIADFIFKHPAHK